MSWDKVSPVAVIGTLDLSERPVRDDRRLGKGKTTPEIQCYGWFYISLGPLPTLSDSHCNRLLCSERGQSSFAGELELWPGAFAQLFSPGRSLNVFGKLGKTQRLP